MPFGQWLAEGAFYASVLLAVILISMIIRSRLWLGDYPEPVRRSAAPPRRGEKAAKTLLDIAFKALWIGYPVFSAFLYKAAMGRSFTMWICLAHMMTLYAVFVAARLLLIDGILICLITPGFVRVDGTKDTKESYRDFRFYAKKALGNFVLSAFFSLLAAGVLSV